MLMKTTCAAISTAMKVATARDGSCVVVGLSAERRLATTIDVATADSPQITVSTTWAPAETTCGRPCCSVSVGPRPNTVVQLAPSGIHGGTSRPKPINSTAATARDGPTNLGRSLLKNKGSAHIVSGKV